MAASRLCLDLLDRRVAIDCAVEEPRALLRRIYSAMLANGEKEPFDLEISVREPTPGRWVVDSSEGPTEVSDLTGLVWAVGTHLVVLLQRTRPELLFLHGAALSRGGAALLLLARSGGGKSTTTWGLLHHGFDLSSDELAPLDSAGNVLPYPRALHLKRRPPSYPLPEKGLVTEPPIHVPLDSIGIQPISAATRPALICFLEHVDAGAAPEITPVGAAEATARVYEVALNPLAHSGKGVDACLALARACPAYRVVTGELDASCRAVRSLFDRSVEERSGDSGLEP